MSLRIGFYLAALLAVTLLSISGFRAIYNSGAKSRDAEVAALNGTVAEIKATEHAATIAAGERLLFAQEQVAALSKARDERNSDDIRRVESDQRNRDAARGDFDKRLRFAVSRACNRDEVYRSTLPAASETRSKAAEAARLLSGSNDSNIGRVRLADKLGEYSREADGINGQFTICYREVAKDGGSSIIRSKDE